MGLEEAFREILLEPSRALALKILSFLPRLIGAILIMCLGWLAARLLRAILVRLLRLLQFERAAQRAGINHFLAEGKIPDTPSDLIARLVYWLIMLMVLVAALNTLGLPVVSQLLNQMLLYIPNVVAAIVVLIIGSLLATIIAAVIKTACVNARITYADALANVGRWAIILFTVTMALDQLNIATETVSIAFGLTFGAICLAAGLAFGLGGRDLAGIYLTKWVKSSVHADPEKTRTSIPPAPPGPMAG